MRSSSLPTRSDLIDDGLLPNLDLWLSTMVSTRKSQSTVEGYSKDIWHFALAFSAKAGSRLSIERLADVKSPLIESIADTWSDAGITSTTCARRFSALRQFCAFLAQSDHPECAAVLANRFPIVAIRRPDGLSERDYSLLISDRHDEPDDWLALRDRAITILQADAGLTTSEIVNLDWESIPESIPVIVVDTTRLAPRLVPRTARAHSAISSYRFTVPASTASGNPVFVSKAGRRLTTRAVQMRFRLRADREGISPFVSPRSLRHRFIDSLAAENFAAAEISEAAGIGGTTVHYHLVPRSVE